MMTIRFRTWYRLCVIIGVAVGLPAMMIAFFEPPLITSVNKHLPLLAEICLVAIGGLGVIVAVLERYGVIRLHYSDADRKSLFYRMAKKVAESEHAMGRRFAQSYYAGYGLPAITGRRGNGGDERTPANGSGGIAFPERLVRGVILLVRIGGWLMAVLGALSAVGVSIHHANGGRIMASNGSEDSTSLTGLASILILLSISAFGVGVILWCPRVVRWCMLYPMRRIQGQRR